MLQPVIDRLAAGRASPNVITTLGTAVLVGAGVAMGMGRVRLGGALLLLSGVFDMLDGRVARASAQTSKFGAFYDSTLDRLGEAALFIGIMIYFLQGGVPSRWGVAAAAVTVGTLSSGVLVSYARARAEGLGLDCRVGIAQRAERIVGLGVPSVFFGAGPHGVLLFGLVAALGLVALVTVVQRIVHVYRQTKQAPRDRATQARRVTPELAQFLGKGRRGE